jgi:hypothetical protein
MARIDFTIGTDVAPEKIRAALLDFTDRRPSLWPGLARDAFEVFWVKDTEAEIQEGSNLPGLRIRAREHYDWSDPELVRWHVVDSNFSQAGDFVEVRPRPREGGGTSLHVVWSRRGKTAVAKAIVAGVVATRGLPIKRSLKQALGRIGKAEDL